MVTWIYNRLDRATITSQWDIEILLILPAFISILPFEKMSTTSDFWLHSLMILITGPKPVCQNQNVGFIEVVNMFTNCDISLHVSSLQTTINVRGPLAFKWFSTTKTSFPALRFLTTMQKCFSTVELRTEESIMCPIVVKSIQVCTLVYKCKHYVLFRDQEMKTHEIRPFFKIS